MAILPKKTFIKYQYRFLAILLFFLIAFFRFYKLSDNFVFDIDTQYQAILAKTIIKHFHIIWIGVSASTIGYYLGPGLVYLTAFLLWLTGGDPISLAFFSSSVGVVTAGSIFYIGNDLFGKRVAFLAAVIYGFSSFVVGYDHRFWPIFVPLIAVWIYYSLVKTKDNSRWLILSVILISSSYHIHLSLLIFWPFIIWFFIKLFKKIDGLTWIISILSYFIITFPLLVFDFVHNFDNLLMPLRFITSVLNKTRGAAQFHLDFLITSLNKVWYVNYQSYPLLSLILTFLFLATLFYLLKRKKNSIFLLLIIILVFLILFSLYPGPIQEYYLVLLFPFISLSAALLFEKMPASIIVPLLFIFIAANALYLITNKDIRGLTAKKALIQTVSQKLSQDYYLDFESGMDIEGWRYLFEAYGKKPAQSKADLMFGWIYPNEISGKKPPIKVTIFNDFKINISNVH